MKKIEFAAARPYAAPSCKLVKMMPRQVLCQSTHLNFSKNVNEAGDDDEYADNPLSF